jgi:GAF domain-containing protein
VSDRHGRNVGDDARAELLTALCELARWSHGAAAVSVAVVTDAGLEYVASSGAGAGEIVGTVLGAGQGLAGFVAATGQSLSVRDAVADPRFAREVAERTGYVPDAIHVVPILDGDGEVAGVMSMLDRAHHAEAPDDPPMGLAGYADLAAALLRGTPSGDGDAVAARLDRLDPAARTAAIAAVAAVLDAIER